VRIALLAQEVAPGYTGGGIGTYTTYLAEGLSSLGHDVTVVGRTGPISLPLRRRWPTLAERVEAALEARKALRGKAFDVVEGPDWLAEAALLPRRTARLHARHIHGGHRTLREHMGWLPSREQRLAERFEAYDLRRAGVITAASRLSCLLPSGERVTPREPVIVPMPVPPGRPAPVPAERVVTLVGRIEERKGPEVLIDAAAGLDCVVRLVGRESSLSYTAALRDRAAAAGVSLDVAGAVGMADMTGVYASSRVVAVPSRYEPFSMVALEALAAARPVVLSDACGAAEVERPGQYVFAGGDATALREHLRALLDDPSAGAAGAAYVREHHSPRAAATAKVAAWVASLS
jgi:glycosyltransferase involved in cell wall biosynthesis